MHPYFTLEGNTPINALILKTWSIAADDQSEFNVHIYEFVCIVRDFAQAVLLDDGGQNVIINRDSLQEDLSDIQDYIARHRPKYDAHQTALKDQYIAKSENQSPI